SDLTMLVANKIDGQQPDVAAAPFFELGLGEVHGIAASHGRGINQLMEEVCHLLPMAQEEEVEGSEIETGIKIAVVGRPNVGKSTLVNRSEEHTSALQS